MCIRIKGTTPGVERGKELSLSVKERSSPKSHSLQADADGLQPVTYVLPKGQNGYDVYGYVYVRVQLVVT